MCAAPRCRLHLLLISVEVAFLSHIPCEEGGLHGECLQCVFMMCVSRLYHSRKVTTERGGGRGDWGIGDRVWDSCKYRDRVPSSPKPAQQAPEQACTILKGVSGCLPCITECSREQGQNDGLDK